MVGHHGHRDKNLYWRSLSMSIVRVPLQRGQFAIVDSEDWLRVALHSWYIERNHRVDYAYAAVDGKKMYLHRFIMQPLEGFEVDHIDGDGLNNRRSNLRIVSHKQNLRNQRLQARSTSGYKGVSWGKSRCLWGAHIRYDGKKRFLGRFPSRDDAARAYNTRASEVFGEYARLNEIPGESLS
jgi:HNH endonuclease